MAGIEKSQKCYDATLAAIVGTQDEDGVFDGDYHDQRPEDQRHDPRDGLGRQRSAGVGRLLECIKRARTDIAVDDTQRGEGRRERDARSAIPGCVRRLNDVGHPFRLPRWSHSKRRS